MAIIFMSSLGGGSLPPSVGSDFAAVIASTIDLGLPVPTYLASRRRTSEMPSDQVHDAIEYSEEHSSSKCRMSNWNSHLQSG